MTPSPGSSVSQMVIRRRLRHGARPMRPHLDAIDPAAVGSYAADRWIRAAGPLVSSGARAAVRAMIGAHVAAIARFAKAGEDDPAAIDLAREKLGLVVRWLFAPWADDPPDPMTVLLDAPDGADEDRLALAVVMISARGRIRLARDGVIAVPEIAALTGLDQSHLARLARQGRLERVGGPVVSKQYAPPIAGESARVLLGEHGVRGI